MPTQLDAGQWQVSADINWGSSALIQSDARERLVIDAETHEMRMTIDGRLSDRLLLSVSLPYRATSGGSLDSFIDDWHDAFGLPPGARRQLPRDQLRLFYQRNNLTVLDQRQSMSGIADASVAAGWQFASSTTHSLTGWIDVKLPTGRSTKLTGSDGVDFSAMIASHHRFAERWSVFTQAGITHPGRGELLPGQQRRWIGSALIGVSGMFWQRLELTAQLDAHTAAFNDTQLDYLNEAVILSVGGSIRLGPKWHLSLGVSEDVMVEASPDVVFIVGLRRAFKGDW